MKISSFKPNTLLSFIIGTVLQMKIWTDGDLGIERLLLQSHLSKLSQPSNSNSK